VRRRLLDAALGVFAEHGYANARLDDVAAAAGLTKGAIYSNFTGKDDIFFAMLDAQVRDRVDAVHAALTAAADADDTQDEDAPYRIGRLLATTITEQREWQLVFLDFWLRAVRDDAVRAQFLTHRREIRAAIADAVEQIVGNPPTDTGFSIDDVVTLVLALSNGLTIEQNIDPGFVSPDLFGRVLAQLSR
jgi:AcrR family transcriptional regulator